MNKFIVAAILAIAANVAIAQDTATVPAIEPEKADPVASQSLTDSFATICTSTAVLSDKARLACFNDTMPTVAKSGDVFRNVGIGAEFNTLIRNETAFAAAN